MDKRRTRIVPLWPISETQGFSTRTFILAGHFTYPIIAPFIPGKHTKLRKSLIEGGVPATAFVVKKKFRTPGTAVLMVNPRYINEAKFVLDQFLTARLQAELAEKEALRISNAKVKDTKEYFLATSGWYDLPEGKVVQELSVIGILRGWEKSFTNANIKKLIQPVVELRAKLDQAIIQLATNTAAYADLANKAFSREQIAAAKQKYDRGQLKIKRNLTET